MPHRQETIEVRTRGRGLHEITATVDEVVRRAGFDSGTVNIFCQHTSASLVIMENADPSATRDLERFLERLAPDADPHYEHTSEGPDDMSAHLRMALTRTSETIPFHARRLQLGTWQGLFLWEHRTSPHRRTLVVTVQGE